MCFSNALMNHRTLDVGMHTGTVSDKTAQSRRGYGTWFAVATLVLVLGVFTLNNVAPYLGLHHAGALTMYSGLSNIADNHFFMPKLSLSDADTYASITRFDPGKANTPAVTWFQEFATWSRQRRRLVHLNFVRYHASRICQSAPNANVGLELVTRSGRRLSHRNVCAHPEMLQYALLSGYAECEPDCHSFLQER
jgi:hypothetical protein